MKSEGNLFSNFNFLTDIPIENATFEVNEVRKPPMVDLIFPEFGVCSRLFANFWGLEQGRSQGEGGKSP